MAFTTVVRQSNKVIISIKITNAIKIYIKTVS